MKQKIKIRYFELNYVQSFFTAICFFYCFYCSAQTHDFKPPLNLETKSANKEELDTVFAYYFNTLFDGHITKEADNTIYSDTYFCPNHVNEKITNLLYTECKICGSKIIRKKRYTYNFTYGYGYNKTSISYSYLEELKIFIAELSDEHFNKSPLYIPFSIYDGLLHVQEVDNFKDSLYLNRLETILIDYKKKHNNAIDSVNSLDIKNKEKKKLTDYLESTLLNKLWLIEKEFEKKYLIQNNLVSLPGLKNPLKFTPAIRQNFITEFRESLSSPDKNNKYYIGLKDGNYNFTIENQIISFNRGWGNLSLNGIKNRNTPNLKFSFIEEKGFNKQHKYILAGINYPTSKYVKEVTLPNGNIITINNAEISPSRNIRDEYTGLPTKAYFVPVNNYELYILSKNGHPMLKIPGGKYTDLKIIGDTVFEVKNTTSGLYYKIMLPDSVKNLSEIFH